MKKSDSIAALAKALSQFQAKVKQPLKDKDNPFFKSKYVPLENVVEAITETSGEFGLSFIQFPLNDANGRVGVTTLLMHESGEWIESEPIFATPAKQDAQGAGSVITYLKRYSLSAIFGITSDEDDDGNSAQHPNQNTNQSGQNNNLISEAQLKALNSSISAAAKRTKTDVSQVMDYAKQSFNIPANVENKSLTRTQASQLIDFINQLQPAQPQQVG